MALWWSSGSPTACLASTVYTNFTSNNYVLSPTLHHVLLKGLLPNTVYFYA